MRLLELYIHIPFCVKKCAYCDFLSGPSDEKSRERYVELLCEEIQVCRGKVEEYQVSTVFFGGGTPSVLQGEQIKRIMETLRKVFVFETDAEISMEMNPGTVTSEKLVAYREAGINRLSIGLQSVQDEELKLLGRIHTYDEFLHSYELARKAGFENINIDLISAIPGQTVSSWAETLKTIVELEPEHISAYSLIIEEGTPFFEKYGEGFGQEMLPSEDEEREMYRQTKQILHEAGYERYEISNYAKEGRECRHNIGYWERAPYLGFGIGAASLFEETRSANPSNIEEYRTSFEKKFQAEKLSVEEQIEEFMFLGLRMMKGISKQKFAEAFGKEIEEIYGKQIERLKKAELLEENDDRIYLTEKGIDISNSVFVEFMF
ncbi:MAG: radical SAM family heme chaperone HemW [bacterium]|nr:radical SAM family heme chaperone HemW [bacterium]